MGIRLLGPLEVDGVRPLEPRDRLVLGVLVVRRGHVVDPEQIAGVVWGDEPPRSWAKQVQICIARLRKTLGPTTIETTGGGYRLVVGDDVLDADSFVRFVERADFLAATGEFDRAAAGYARALGMWRGSPLDELDGWDLGRVEAARFEELRRTAEESWLDVRLAAGEHRAVATEAPVFVEAEPLRERRWAILALAQYRCSRQTDALRTLSRARLVLLEQVGVGPGAELTSLEAAILAQDPALDALPASRTAGVDACPYKGMAPYGESDADEFFGRGLEIDACLRRLDVTPLLVVAGPSGCGKSSLLRAGLVPALRRTGRDVAVVVPGSDPVGAITSAAPSPPRWSVLVVDQFEELFAPGHDGTVVEEVCSYVVQRARTGAPVVLAVRSDHIGALSSNAELRRLTESGLHLLGSLAGDDLRSAIEQPAALHGLHLEPGLVELVVREGEGDAGALPMLSHALVETWIRRESNTLTVEGYRSSGGIGGAVARSADHLYDSLPTEQRSILRSLLLRLVTPTLDGAPVRCRVPSRAVLGDPDRDRVIGLLVRARLVTAHDESFELAHEALARAWPRLRAWLDEDVSGQRILRHLAVAADGWDAYGRVDGELYRGARLDAALEWRAAAEPALTSIESAFLEASSEHDKSERRQITARAQHEARQNRRLRALLASVGVLLVVALVIGAVALAASDRATTQRRNATVRELANAAMANLDVDPERSVLLALAAVERAGSGDDPTALAAENALHRSITASRIERRIDGVGARVAWNPNGTMMAALGARGTSSVEIRDASTGGHLRSIVADGVEPSNVSWDATGQLLGVTYLNGAARVIDATTGETKLEITGTGSAAVDSTFSPDGSKFAAAWPSDAGGVVRVLTIDTGETRTIPALRGAQAVAFDPTGTRLAVGMAGGEAPAILDLTSEHSDPMLLDYRPSGFGVTGVAWSPAGNAVATSADDGSVRVFDASTGAQRIVIPGHGAYVAAIDWSSDSTRLVSASTDGTAKVWGLLEGGGRPLLTLSAQDTRAGIADVAFSPDSTRVAVTTEARSSVTIWDVGLSGGAEVANLPAASFGWNAAVFDRDGTRLFTSRAGGGVHVWDALTFDPLDPLGVDPPRDVAPSMIPGVPMTTYGTTASHIAVTRDGTLVTMLADQGGVTGDGVVPVWNTATGELVFTARVGSRATNADWSPDGRLLAIAGGTGDDTTVTILDRSGSTVSEFPVPGARIGSLAFMPDGERIIATLESFGAYDPRFAAVVVWDANTGTELQRISTEAWSAVPGPTEGLVVIAPHQSAGVQDVTVWDLESEVPVLTLTGHSGNVQSVAVNPSGSRIAAASGDGSIVVWDASTGDLLLTLRGHTGFASYVSFSADGTRLASAGVDGTVRIWTLDRDELVEVATSRLTRDLTNEECREFLHLDRCIAG